MPVNRNALIRYKTIDQCLQNNFRKWTLEDLIEACSEALYEYEGIDKGISKRTIQSDIQMMRSDKLGYNAPIIVKEKKYYQYEDANYSITNIPISQQDLGKLLEAIEFMKQFQGFSHFRELDGMVQKLEDHIYSQKNQTASVIDFEKNENLKGLKWLDPLYKAITQKRTITLNYQSFKSRYPKDFHMSPYLLKEFRNRWFIIGKLGGNKGIFNLALDRILDIKASEQPYTESPDFDPQSYFKDTIGVTVNPNQKGEDVRLFVTQKHAPYVLTKPFHASQKLEEQNQFGIIISLKVQHNFELEKDILGFGDGVKVISPKRLRENIRFRMKTAMSAYDNDINEKIMVNLYRKMSYRGGALLPPIYTETERNKILNQISNHIEYKNELSKELQIDIFNQNLTNISAHILGTKTLTDAFYFELEKGQIIPWNQNFSTEIKTHIPFHSLMKKIECDDSTVQTLGLLICFHQYYDTFTGLNVFHRSHLNKLSPKEIELISSNTLAHQVDLSAMSAFVFQKGLLTKLVCPPNFKSAKFIYLEWKAID
ncbi:helix-turn-helix transcriptional regulator [Sediminitomix flava]|uniref:Putative DNA-binding transcriptional regulator YafY n=1 Tax=Sediminitomix flava TaxID=379075 RepID=A0A315ZBT9_SEDFL|nr:WYL domain-containing protein [Sediminitomix flava]PWJ42174.1 putative DNA-binding transcriptional regulator YafY [Sediminitomix flava]